jgi:hypothetical protein
MKILNLSKMSTVGADNNQWFAPIWNIKKGKGVSILIPKNLTLLILDHFVQREKKKVFSGSLQKRLMLH